MAAKANSWKRDELLVAFNLYCQIPFGKMHKSNSDVVRLARLIGRTPSSVAMKLVNFASLDPEITETGRRGLGNASAADRSIWNEFHNDWEQLALESKNILTALTMDGKLDTPFSDDDSAASEMDYEGTTKAVLTEVRIKQSFFRKAILSSYQNRCCISSLQEPRLLIASHIIPWSADKSNRLNPRNGLCLSALHDRAFDVGLITITPDYRLRVSKQVKKHTNVAMMYSGILKMEGMKILLPEKFWPSRDFLGWHNKNRFVEGIGA